MNNIARFVSALLMFSAPAANASPTSTCVVDKVSSMGTKEPTIVLQNHCGTYIDWRMCIRVEDRAFDDKPSGYTAPNDESSYRLWLPEGNQSFTYNYTYVERGETYIQPPEPECKALPEEISESAKSGEGADRSAFLNGTWCSGGRWQVSWEIQGDRLISRGKAGAESLRNWKLEWVGPDRFNLIGHGTVNKYTVVGPDHVYRRGFLGRVNIKKC